MRRYVFAALLASSVSPASSARVVTADFAPSAPMTVNQTVSLRAESSNLPGWMMTSRTIDLVSTQWKAPTGGRSIARDRTPRRTNWTATSGTVIGSSYDLRFDMAAIPVDRPDAKVIRVSAGLDSATLIGNLRGGGLAAMNGTPQPLGFLPTALEQVLTFRAPDGTGSGATIDPASIALRPVPLPATAPLALLGMAALALFRRRKTLAA